MGRPYTLTADQIGAIPHMKAARMSTVEISRCFGVHQSTIAWHITGKCKTPPKHGPRTTAQILREVADKLEMNVASQTAAPNTQP